MKILETLELLPLPLFGKGIQTRVYFGKYASGGNKFGMIQHVQHGIDEQALTDVCLVLSGDF